MSGYKSMMRDRMPLVMDLALKWCKAKNRWIDYVYDNIIKKYPQNARSMMVKRVLGITRTYSRIEIYDYFRYVLGRTDISLEDANRIPSNALYMQFGDTIDYEKLHNENPDMYNYWKTIEDWVNWFKYTHQYIENDYNILKQKGLNEERIKTQLMSEYSLSIKLVNYLIKSFN